MGTKRVIILALAFASLLAIFAFPKTYASPDPVNVSWLILDPNDNPIEWVDLST